MSEPWRTVLAQRRPISPEEEGRYLEIPFEVPSGMDSLRVRLSVEGDGAVLDLGLLGPDGVAGWSGSARSTIEIRPDHSSPGYLPGPPQGGAWKVLLGTYTVPRGGCSADLAVECLAPRPRWLRGDLHVHTTHSDGQDTPAGVAVALADLGMDFVALTDHNNGTAYHSFPEDAEVLAIPAVEWTTLKGHANLFGLERPFPDFRAESEAQVLRLAREAREKGALLSISHPFEDSCKGCAWDWPLDDLPLDAVEIWNGPWRPANQKAVDWWQTRLAHGRRIVALGGSDRHSPHLLVQYGLPTNWVFAAAHSRFAILDALRKGHVCLTASLDGPLLDLRLGDFMQGDVAQGASPGPLRLSVPQARKGDRVVLISDRGAEREETVGADGRWALGLDPAGRLFWRAELHRWSAVFRCELPAAFSNPVYLAKDA